MIGASPRSVLWRAIEDDSADEFCTLTFADGKARVCGSLVGVAAQQLPFACSYRIEARENLTAADRLDVQLAIAGSNRSLSMSRVKDGWMIGEAFIEADEIDVEWSPATNFFPMRRLLETKQENLSLTAAWVRFPELGVEQSRQRYDRIDERTMRYTNLGSGFSALIHHDGDGFPLDYEGIWKHRASWKGR